jgi:sortase A
MNPDEKNSSKGGKQLSQQRSIIIPPESETLNRDNEPAIKLIKNKIDNLFDGKNAIEDKNFITEEPDNPYEKTHAEHVEPQTSDWQKYHTAWQNYYQKYYEGYYTHHLNQAKENLKKPEPEEEIEAKLKQQLVTKIKESTKKVRKSRHFIPLLSGVVVILLALFIQYNSIIIGNVMAYTSPGNINPQNIVIDPNIAITVSPESRLIIPKINVDVPVFYDIGNDYKSQMSAMSKGLAHFAVPGASSHPGQIGNTVIAGHSASDLFSQGDYKFIFAQLEKLEIGDLFYANYNSVRYTYIVNKKEVVGPNDVDKLVYPTDKPLMTLLTCVPVGTDSSRLLVIAEQISPNPSKSTLAPAVNQNDEKSSIPGKTPTFFERLFGIN